MAGVTEGDQPGGPDDRILFWPQVKAISGLSRTTVWRMQRAGEFPVCVQVSRGRVGWWESQLLTWKRTRTPHRLPEPRPFHPVERPAGVATDIERAPGDPVRTRDADRRCRKPADLLAVDPVPVSRGRRRNASVDQIAFDFGS